LAGPQRDSFDVGILLLAERGRGDEQGCAPVGQNLGPLVAGFAGTKLG
jgi:hypothetical protein